MVAGRTPYLAKCRRARLPLVFWGHDAPDGRHWLERWAGRTPPDLVVANSNYTNSLMPNLFPACPAPSSCPVRRRRSATASKFAARSRAELATPAEAVVIVMASRLDPWKGHAPALRCADATSKYPRMGMLDHGRRATTSGRTIPLGAAGRRCPTNLVERVRFLGFREDVFRVLAASDIHCQPNTGPEGFRHCFCRGVVR